MNPSGKSRKSHSLRRACAVTAIGMILGCAAKVRPTEDTNSLLPGSAGDAGSSPNVPMTTSTESNEGDGDESLSPTGLVESPTADGSQSAGQNQSCDLADAGACPPILLCEGDSPECESTCPGCFIDGGCIADGAANPANSCLVCDVARDGGAWSPNDGATCDDGFYCTVEDSCTGGACRGGARECEDGVECNGISACDEAADICTLPASQCGDEAVCNAATDTCESTCAGCVVLGVCVLEGAEAAGNPCQVCDPERSTTTYSVAVGKSCGAAATTCSGQDTCNAQGVCQPNHAPANTPCGNATANACDQADACDGAGNCQQRVAQNGTACNDGQFCSTGDQCQAGQCTPTGQQNCGANRTCNEAADQCQCQGCQIGGSCVAANSTNPQNPCQICNPAINPTGFSINAGAPCGSSANTECSAPDICSAQGQCLANNDPNGSACSGGSCQNGECAVCNGCRIGGGCVQPGTANTQNPCQVCNPAINPTGFSVNAGAPCGSAANTECSAPDTCNAQGQCSANNDPNGSACAGGSCQNGQCAPAGALGDPCQTTSQCSTGTCEPFFPDGDGDSFASAGAARSSFCATVGFTKQGFTRVQPTSRQTTDCLDTNRNVNPGQAAFFTEPAGSQGYDYNCDGVQEKRGATIVNDDACFADGADGSCTATGIFEDSACGEIMVATSCIRQGPTDCRLFIADSLGARGCH